MTFYIDGVVCQHEKEAIPSIEHIVADFNPALVIEFGTKRGGFTSILQGATEDSTDIYSYDYIDYPWNARLPFRDNVRFIIADILSEPLSSIVELCSRLDRKLLYCDNGDKIKEFNMYAGFLNDGDLLGTHDWGVEIFPAVVEDVLVNFTPHRHEEFEKSGWGTRFWIKGAN